MALTYTKARRIWWPVTFYPPDDSGSGRSIAVTSNFLWELCSSDLLQNQEISEAERAAALRAQLLEKLHDWDIEDNNHAKIPCTPETIEEIMEEPWIATRLMEEWLQCSLGGGAKKKSARLRSTSARGES